MRTWLISKTPSSPRDLGPGLRRGDEQRPSFRRQAPSFRRRPESRSLGLGRTPSSERRFAPPPRGLGPGLRRGDECVRLRGGTLLRGGTCLCRGTGFSGNILVEFVFVALLAAGMIAATAQIGRIGVVRLRALNACRYGARLASERAVDLGGAAAEAERAFRRSDGPAPAAFSAHRFRDTAASRFYDLVAVRAALRVPRAAVFGGGEWAWEERAVSLRVGEP